MRGFFKKLKIGLEKTRSRLVGQLTETVTGRPQFDEELFEEIEEVLIASDCGVETAGLLAGRLREECSRRKTMQAAEVLEILKEQMVLVLAGDAPATTAHQPHVILFVGVNGTGKTTSIGKIGAQLKAQGKQVLFAAADTFRAAAREQLQIWAGRSGADIVTGADGSDPAAVAFDAVSAAITRGRDVVLIDTAGRLHTRHNLMEELKKISRAVGKAMPGAPHETLLVLDATTGQNGVAQAETFGAAVGLTGLVLTKLDGTAKGGIVLGIRHRFGVPVKWVGVGEKPDDLETFDPAEFVAALFQ
jgi:fused signal recognition particle receptor